MRKIFILFFGVLVCASIIYFATHKKKDLIVGTNPTFPPLEYIGGDSGADIIGPNIELVKMIASDTGRDYHLDIVQFTELFDSLESGKIDISIGGLAITEERKKLVDFSDPYYSVSVVALVREDDASFDNVRTKEELGQNKRLGTRNGSVLEATVRSIIGASSYETKASWGLIVHELLNGKIDAVIINDAVADVFLLKYDNLEILPIEFETLHHGIAVKKGNAKLLDSINKTIENVNISGEYARLVEEYTKKYADEMLEDFQSR